MCEQEKLIHIGAEELRRAKPKKEVEMADNEQELERPASQQVEPVLSILDMIWNILNDGRLDKWMKVRGSTSPDIVGFLDMYISDAKDLQAKLKAMGYDKVRIKCPDCDGKGETKPREFNGVCYFKYPCPTCKGTGKITKYVKWDREKVAEKLYGWLTQNIDEERWIPWSDLKDRDKKWYREHYADQLYRELTGE